MKAYESLLKTYLDYQSKYPFNGQPAELYDPANYILGLGGKRIRPLLALIGAQMVGDDTTTSLPLAHAVEVFHNFTLMHDDIMDRAEVRRGQKTVHVKWNDNIAILSGDMMLVHSYRLLTQLNVTDKLKNTVIQSFSDMAEEVCVGQQFDMNFETSSDISEDAYIRMIKLKTSVLLAWSLQNGALVAGMDVQSAEILYQYGVNLGIAFQVMDDYLDTFGDAEQFGKKIGGDILENKKTLLWIEATKRANAEQLGTMKMWSDIHDQPDEKIKVITALYRELGVDGYARDKMEEYFNVAQKHLDTLPSNYDTHILEEVADNLRSRQS